jgi:hypothetical protein
MGQRSRCTLGRRMGTVEGDMILGVSEFFNLEDLKFSILLGEREDPGATEVERSAMCRAVDCELHHGQCHGLRQFDSWV